VLSSSTAAYKLHQVTNTNSLSVQLRVYDACHANEVTGSSKTLAEIGAELKLVPTAQIRKDDDKRTAAHKKLIMAASVSRYYRQAKCIVYNTGLGIFPKAT
jgi:hypothetical protein